MDICRFCKNDPEGSVFECRGCWNVIVCCEKHSSKELASVGLKFIKDPKNGLIVFCSEDCKKSFLVGAKVPDLTIVKKVIVSEQLKKIASQREKFLKIKRSDNGFGTKRIVRCGSRQGSISGRYTNEEILRKDQIPFDIITSLRCTTVKNRAFESLKFFDKYRWLDKVIRLTIERKIYARLKNGEIKQREILFSTTEVGDEIKTFIPYGNITPYDELVLKVEVAVNMSLPLLAIAKLPQLIESSDHLVIVEGIYVDETRLEEVGEWIFSKSSVFDGPAKGKEKQRD